MWQSGFCPCACQESGAAMSFPPAGRITCSERGSERQFLAWNEAPARVGNLQPALVPFVHDRDLETLACVEDAVLEALDISRDLDAVHLMKFSKHQLAHDFLFRPHALGLGPRVLESDEMSVVFGERKHSLGA